MPDGYSDLPPGATSIQPPAYSDLPKGATSAYSDLPKGATSVPQAEPEPTFTQKYIEPALGPTGAVLGGVAGGMLAGPGGAIAGAALGDAAGEATRQGIERVAGRQQKSAEIVPMVKAGTQGAAAEMGGQLMGKAIETATPYIKSGVDTVKDYYGMGPKVARGNFPAYSSELPKMGVPSDPSTGVQNPQGNPTPFKMSTEVPTMGKPMSDSALKTKIGQVVKQAASPAEASGPVYGPETSLQAKYPDKAVRQMVHANGERIVDAVADNPKLIKEVHSLTAQDIRQAWINSGEKVEPGAFSGGKYRWSGTGQGREADLNYLLDKGFRPEDIVRLAKGK